MRLEVTDSKSSLGPPRTKGDLSYNGIGYVRDSYSLTSTSYRTPLPIIYSALGLLSLGYRSHYSSWHWIGDSTSAFCGFELIKLCLRMLMKATTTTGYTTITTTYYYGIYVGIVRGYHGLVSSQSIASSGLGSMA